MTQVDRHRQIMDGDSPISSRFGSFTLVKYFSFTSLGVFLLFTIILSLLISNNARQVMLEQSEENSLLLAENINQQVFRRFVLPAVIRYGGIALRKPEQFELLDTIIRGVTEGLKIDSVTLYDSSMNIISYSTNPELVGLKDKGIIEYENALLGISSSRLTISGSFFSFLHLGKEVRCELRTFIPFRQVKSSGKEGDLIMGVIEIEKDLTSNYRNILRFQARIIILASVLMVILFFVLRLIVSRAGEKIERRTEERKKLQEKLNRAERLAHLGEMVATVSHEIKSPLGIVRSTAEILEKRIEKLAPGNEHLARIVVDETIRLNKIVVEFLDFARPKEPELKAEKLSKVLKRVLDFLGPELKRQGVELVADLDYGLPPCKIDEDQLYRAFLNILVNGLQAMDDGGRLEVGMSQQGSGSVVVKIKDNGCGMETEKLERVFEPFFTDKSKGTGLGLAIARNSIVAHHGEITVTSELGLGTEFFISLPTA